MSDFVCIIQIVYTTKIQARLNELQIIFFNKKDQIKSLLIFILSSYRDEL